ncbi:glycosyltransferase family 2 protein [Winogradskyella sp. KYW1333]|uniref:glycosyltransferase family 2 protein n=1 Tax=Winogradskyella sp. KYW1333 TaxID=2282123 RepID=UPI000DF19BA1|nr:glycosyltransferase [Winogradskyella sp. KYW1333]RCT54770.1 glycosyltransferase family 2 protein [Winogradskyella sp. KYW1333]
MNFSLVICTYMRAQPLLRLLNSIKTQTLSPNEILIIDGSTNIETEQILKVKPFNNLKYFKVNNDQRGLTRQRNFGIQQISNDCEIICFLDDDIILEENYFKELISTYKIHQNALAVGGYITNEVNWMKSDRSRNPSNFYYDGWMRKEPSRFKIRGKFGLLPDSKPGFLPSFSHGRSIGFLPPSGKIYEVELIMGGVSSFKKEVFDKIKFSTYFEGYGLYEDTDFTLRLSKLGKLFVNTAAQLEHHHDAQGRPNKYQYGKMVARNGWYVWRVKYPKPGLKDRIKWNLTFILLMKLRFLNVVTTKNRHEALTESIGRLFGWFSLLFNKPKIQR